MPAFLSWVDSSSADRERMRRAIELFSEKDTRDELGLGTIRDAFADAFFPGTSTVETRLRYCLFVPWIYRELERARVSAAELPRRLRKLETDLIFVLLDADDHDGTIGARAKRNIQRLPSSVYWATLQRWRICWFAGSQDQLHRHFDQLRRRRHRALVPDDEGAREAAESIWHPRLPAPPEGWPDEASFDLRLEEAEFLRGRIQSSCEHTVLAELATHGQPGELLLGCQGELNVERPSVLDSPPLVGHLPDLLSAFTGHDVCWQRPDTGTWLLAGRGPRQ